MSLKIAEQGKPHTITETLISTFLREVLIAMIQMATEAVMKSIPLSNETIPRRIDDMAKDVEDQLVFKLRTTFVLQLDKSTLTDSRAFLMAYVRFGIIEELLFCRPLATDCKG